MAAAAAAAAEAATTATTAAATTATAFLAPPHEFLSIARVSSFLDVFAVFFALESSSLPPYLASLLASNTHAALPLSVRSLAFNMKKKFPTEMLGFLLFSPTPEFSLPSTWDNQILNNILKYIQL